MRRGPKPAKSKVASKPPVARKSAKNADSRVRDLEKRLEEALRGKAEALKLQAEAQEQQTATSEILRVISRSQTDVQPVFDTIVRSAVRLCDGLFSALYQFDGELIHQVAQHNFTPEALEVAHRVYPARPNRASGPARAILECAIVHIPDVAVDTEYRHALSQAIGFRSGLFVPMLRERVPIGVIAVARAESRPFSDTQIELLKTFAAQAVIAIENVRLFNETKEALEQQTATSEILQVISSSPTNIRPVFAAVAGSAARLCGAFDATIFQVDADGLRVGAHEGPISAHPVGQGPSLGRGTPPGRAVLDRRTIHIADVQADVDEYPEGSAHARRFGHHTVLVVPMLRAGESIGAIAVRRTEVQPFSDKQIRLLQTFADQAVIAIENVRLFTELEARNRELTAALDTQTATSDILRVISQSQTDAGPVFEAIVDSAVRLLRAYTGTLTRVVGEQIVLEAFTRTDAAGDTALQGRFPVPVVSDSSHALTLRDRAPLNVADADADPRLSVWAHRYARVRGYRSQLVVPLLRQADAIGTISVTRRERGGFEADEIALIQTFADQAVIAIENVRLFTELQEKNRALTQAHGQVTEALERQTATSEILRVISSSPTDEKPVFDAIARSSVQLCAAAFAVVASFDGELLHFVAGEHVGTEGRRTLAAVYPMRPGRGQLAGRAILDQTVIHVADVMLDPEYVGASLGNRATLSVPMLRTGAPIGTITIARFEPVPFTEQQIALLKTFADQAVIAIENVRLFKELQEKNSALTQAHAQVTEALEQQTATSEILQVISSSPTDVLPVFEAITDSAMRLFSAWAAAVFRYEGQLISMAAARGGLPGSADAVMAHLQVPHAPTEERPEGRTALTRTIQHVVDVDNDMSWGPRYREDARARGFRSYVAVPMLRGDVVVGVITVSRQRVGGFAPGEISLLQTFADQAVIAIENVRLFTETKEALDRQTATAEILRVISSSPTNDQPVFDAIARSGVTVCEGLGCAVFVVDGDMVRVAATYGVRPERVERFRREYPIPLDAEIDTAQMIRGRRIFHLADIEHNPDATAADVEYARLAGYRTRLMVPMVRGDRALGLIAVTRETPTPFSERQVELLRTFADQAVIAIENVRLFKELEGRNRELTTALDQQMATSEILRVISNSPTDTQPVFDTIVTSAQRLIGAFSTTLSRVVDDELHLVASTSTTPSGDGALRAMYPLRLTQAPLLARAIANREPLVIDDTETDPRITPLTQGIARQRGFRSTVQLPLVHRDGVIGVIAVSHAEAGAFSRDEMELLKTFADQAVIAIENVRLFKELEVANRELEAASQHKSEFLANMSHELRTPLNAIIGFSEVLGERMFGDLNEKQDEYLKDIHASGQHLLSLINDILDLSKIEAGRMELELSDFDLPTAIDSALTLVRERAGRRAIALHLSVAERLGQVQADERKIRQVVLNLLSNAIKFTPEGGRIDVGAVPKDGLVEISVSDTGVGIAPEDQEAVFEEFRQVGTADKKVEGTGLGLTLCRKFVELHGGRIWVKSQVGVGSTFTFTIPVRRGE